MSIALYAKEVITREEREEIGKKTSEADQMVEVIDIVRASLVTKMTVKYKGLLEAMEESEDPDLKAKAKELG